MRDPTDSRGVATYYATDIGRDTIHSLMRQSFAPYPGPGNEATCAQAAEWGYLHALQWLRAQQPRACPWNGSTCTRAATMGYLHILVWALSQNPWCPWDIQQRKFAFGVLHDKPMQERYPFDDVIAAGTARADVIMWMRETFGLRWSRHQREAFLWLAYEVGSYGRIQWALRDERRRKSFRTRPALQVNGHITAFMHVVDAAVDAVIPVYDLADLVKSML